MSRRFAAIVAVSVIGLGIGACVVRAADKPADDAKTAAPAAAGITGTWTWSVERNGNTMTSTLKLKQDGDKLTGTLEGSRGGPAEIKDGSVKDGAVSFKVVRSFNGNEMTSTYTGKLDGESLKLKVETERNGQTQTRDIEAKRASDAPKADAPKTDAPKKD